MPHSPFAGWLNRIVDSLLATAPLSRVRLRLRSGGSRQTGIGRSFRRRKGNTWSITDSMEQRVLLANVRPYLQNPAPDAMTVMWFTETNTPGTLTVNLPAGGTLVFNSTPAFKSELSYNVNEPLTDRLNAPYMHRIRVTGLTPGTTYNYTVNQGAEVYTSHFKTSPTEDSSVRFIVYGDTETTPSANGHFVNWAQPFGNANRTYVVEQTEGLRQNNNIIESRNPDFLGIAGDIVDAGGEQRDWDELWRHMAGSINDLGSSIPILGTPGNHDDYGGVAGGYSDAGSIIARNKFSTYFESPDNGSSVPEFKDRYFRLDYGPITFISIDVSNGSANGTSSDTNWLLGAGPNYPDFNPGSIQYQWLEAQLADAQATSRFTFVELHHAPYSVGPHGFPTGTGTGFDNQSGQPVRVLTPLFAQYGVDAVFGGHDEMYQHSVVSGINFYEIGTAGDELRRPSSGPDGSTGLPSSNPYQTFLPHLDAPEVWNGNQLVSGGKHYGHLEVNVSFDPVSGTWKAQIDPAYAFPLMNTAGQVTGWERRVYNDTTILTANAAPTGIAVTPAIVAENQPIGTTVGLLGSTDASGNTHTYSFVTGTGDTDNSRFTLVGNSLKTAAIFDFETKDSYTIRVRSTDQGGLTFEQQLTINVSDVQESSPPVIGGFDTPVTFIENGLASLLDTNATVIDTDSADFAGGVLTVSLVAGATSDDQLLIRDQGVGTGRISLGLGNTVSYSGVVIGNYTGGVSGTPLVVTLGPAGSKTAVQALIRDLVFSNTSESPATLPRTVQLQLRDGDGGTSAAVTKTINVTAVNDAPVISSFGNNLSYTEDGSPIIVTTGALISDVDSINFDTGKLIVQVLVNAHASDRIGIRHQGTNPGQIGISGANVTYGGIVIGTFAGTTVLTVTLNANADSASAQALLRNITFQNISQAPSTLTRTISATLSDGDGGTSLAVTKTVAVTALNDDPVIGAFDTTITYVENAVPLLLDTNATVVDPDLRDFDGGVLTVSLTVNGHANDRLAIRNQGTGAGLIGINLGSVTYSGVAIGTFTGGTSGTDPLRITFNAAASSLAVQALVRNLTFNHVSESPATLPRTVQLQLTDGDGGTSAAVTKTINVTAVNDAPVVSSFGENLSYTEDGSPIIVTTGALISDVDSINFDTGKLIVSVLANAHASDRIGIRHQGTNPGQIGISGTSVSYGGVMIGTFAGTYVLTVTLNANANSESVQALLRNITFQNTSQAPSTLTRTLSATLSDGDGGTSLAVTKTVAVTALNDDPVIGAFDTTITYVENAVPILLDTNATVVDPDLKDFDGGVLTVRLTVNGHANDRLAIRNQGTGAGLIGVNLGAVTYGGVAIGIFTGGTSGADPLRITFNAAANSLAVQALVRNLTFNQVSESPTILPRTVQLQLTDGDGGTSAAVTKTINVTAVNDAPVVTGFNDSVAYFIQGVPVILDFDTTITDVDSTNFDTGNLTVSLTTNVQATDRLSIASVGNDPGQIRTAVNAVSSSVVDVFYENVLIGSYSAASTTTLKVTLNANSSSAAVGALLRRVTFHSTSATPSTAVRTVQVSVNDGDGKTSLVAAKTISINTPVTPTGIWTDGSPTANLTSNHVLGAATRLSNGTVIVAGGLTGAAAITTAEVYNPITRTWSTTGPLGTARWSLDAITLENGKALFAGGASAFSASAALASAELYDPATGTFSPTMNNLSVGRQSFGISRLNNGRILITGGNATGNILNGTGVTAVDIYDPVTNSFSSAAPLHSGRALHAQVTLSDGRVLVIGGAQRDAELYDPSTDTWSVSSNLLPTTLKDMKAFELYNGRIFIAAGQNTVDGVTTDATWFFDIGTMLFTPGPSMSGFNSAVSGPQVGASDYSAFDLFPVGHPLRGRYLLFAGGEHDPLVGPDVELNSASIFDAQQNRFFNVGPMPFTHDDHTESLLQINAAGNPEVLVFGGGQTQGTSRFEFLISSLG